MTIAELFPGWMAHQVAFFERHENAIVTVANFMARNHASWDTVVMIEQLLRNCAKAECICGMPWEIDMEQMGCWHCGALTPNVELTGDPLAGRPG